ALQISGAKRARRVHFAEPAGGRRTALNAGLIYTDRELEVALVVAAGARVTRIALGAFDLAARGGHPGGVEPPVAGGRLVPAPRDEVGECHRAEAAHGECDDAASEIPG